MSSSCEFKERSRPDTPEPKFFPAEAVCPTDGISTANAASYLTLPNVGCGGASWITPSDGRVKALTPAPNRI
jgi:hypothetical protein